MKGHWARVKTEGGRGSIQTQVCSLHACFALTSGSEPLAEAFPHLDLPNFFVLELECSLAAGFELGATQCNHNCPLVANEQLN